MATHASNPSRWEYWRQTALQTAKSAARSGIDFILPPGCPCCGRETTAGGFSTAALCLECLRALTPEAGVQCERCAAPIGPNLNPNGPCYYCRNDRFHFEGVIRLGVYRDTLRSAVLRAKSINGEAISRILADRLLENRADDWAGGEWDVVVPMPCHWTRRLAPRHLASETLGERLAEQLRLPYDRRLLRKVRWTPQQTGSSATVRRQQQRHAFRAAATLSGTKILLVDDVLTTGATANEAAKALKARDAASITVAVIARALGDNG